MSTKRFDAAVDLFKAAAEIWSGLWWCPCPDYRPNGGCFLLVEIQVSVDYDWLFNGPFFANGPSRVYFYQGASGQNAQFPDEPGVLGQMNPKNGKTVVPAYDFTTDDGFTARAICTMVHEIGHGLGIDFDRSGLLDSGPMSGSERQCEPTEFDIAALASLHCYKSKCCPRLVNGDVDSNWLPIGDRRRGSGGGTKGIPTGTPVPGHGGMFGRPGDRVLALPWKDGRRAKRGIPEPHPGDTLGKKDFFTDIGSDEFWNSVVDHIDDK